MIKSQRYPETGLFKDVYRAINRLIDDLNYLKLNPGINTQIHRSPWGSYVKGNARQQQQEAVPASISPYVVKSIETDYLICAPIEGGVVQDESVNIVLPWDLRRSPFDGRATQVFNPRTGNSLSVTYTYVTAQWRTGVSTGGIQTVEVITPPFTPDQSIIYAAELEELDANIAGGATKIDLNLSARAWGKVF